MLGVMFIFFSLLLIRFLEGRVYDCDGLQVGFSLFLSGSPCVLDPQIVLEGEHAIRVVDQLGLGTVLLLVKFHASTFFRNSRSRG